MVLLTLIRLRDTGLTPLKLLDFCRTVRVGTAPLSAIQTRGVGCHQRAVLYLAESLLVRTPVRDQIETELHRASRMTISTIGRDEGTLIACDGCGRMVRLATCDWYDVLQFLDDGGWQTVPFDYGYGEGYEHFCSDDCLDPEEWDDDD